jgi:hypothetical protein
MKLKSNFELAADIAYKITLNRIIVTNKNYAPRTIDYWRVDREKVKQQLQQLLTEDQRFLLNDDLFEDIISALYERLHHRLFLDGITY